MFVHLFMCIFYGETDLLSLFLKPSLAAGEAEAGGPRAPDPPRLQSIESYDDEEEPEQMQPMFPTVSS